MIAAGFCFALYGLGIPLAGALILFRNRHRFQDTRFVSVYGFLFRGFEQTGHPFARFWEVLVVMPRKVVFTMLGALLGTTPTLIQALCAVYFLFANVVLHTRYLPYTNERLDRVESYSLVTSFTTLFLGILFLVNEEEGGSEQVGEALTVLVILLQAAMLIIFIHGLVVIVIPQQVATLRTFLELRMRRTTVKVGAAEGTNVAGAPAASTQRTGGSASGSLGTVQPVQPSTPATIGEPAVESTRVLVRNSHAGSCSAAGERSAHGPGHDSDHVPAPTHPCASGMPR